MPYTCQTHTADSARDRAQLAEQFHRFCSEPTANDPLAAEIAALRSEIAALRADLAPAPSLLITGAQAQAEYRRLVGA
jgi:hypothetical protein